MTHNIRKSGFPTLAYPKCDNASPVSLSLVLISNESRAQTTLCLQTALSLEGFDREQSVILQYDADNIVPGTISLGPATIPLPQERLDVLARTGNTQIRTLSLTLRKVCPVWCMPLCGSLMPRPGCEPFFHQFAKLAKATEVEILFDYNWLHRGLQTSLQRLIEHPDQLCGFPVHQRYRQQQYRKSDWTVFDTRGADAYADADATTEDEEPPPVYVEASSKRPRQVSGSPTPCSSPPKRVLLSPFPEDLHTSPTEKGSTASLSHTPTHFSATASPRSPPLVASCPIPPDSISATVGSALPTNEPPSLRVPASDLQRAVEQAVSHLLPSLLPRLLAPSSPAPSSQQSVASQISHAPPPPKLNALGITLHDRLASRIEGEMQSLYAHTLSHANWLRNAADDTFAEMLEGERLALDRAAESKFEDFKEQCEGLEDDVVERVGWKMEELGDAVKDKLAQEKVSLDHEREELRKEKEELIRDKEELRRDKQDVRREKEDLRRERDKLRRDQERFESEKGAAAQSIKCDEQGKRTNSAPG